MKSTQSESDQLAAWLKTGDPLHDQTPLTEAEAKLMRRNIQQAAAEPSTPWFGRPKIWLATAVAVAAVGLLALFITLTRPPVEPEPTMVAANDGSSDSRQIQFETPGGTRIIWVLKHDAATFPD